MFDFKKIWKKSYKGKKIERKWEIKKMLKKIKIKFKVNKLIFYSITSNSFHIFFLFNEKIK